MDKIILQKFIAESGFCSRRQAEKIILSGRVLVNGAVAEAGMKVDASDEVVVNGKKIGLAKEKRYIILNKPKGYTCTSRKFAGEHNVFELLPEEFSGLQIAGRLDKESRGLLLMTDDGDLTLRATHPRYQHEKKYIAQIYTNLRQTNTNNKPEDVERALKKGIDIGEGDGVVKAKEAEYIGNDTFVVVLTEGKKRQIRRMFKKLGYETNDLKRTKIGNLEIGSLGEGKWRVLTKEEIKGLKL